MYASSRPAFTDFMLNTAKLVHFLEMTKRFPKYFIYVVKHKFYPPRLHILTNRTIFAAIY